MIKQNIFKIRKQKYRYFSRKCMHIKYIDDNPQSIKEYFQLLVSSF